MEKRNILVQIKNLSFGYNGDDVLHDVHLQIMRGDFIALIGPNGGGKTTLVKLILGLLSPCYGSVLVADAAPGVVKGVVGYVPQSINHNQNFPATALDVVCMGLFTPEKRGVQHLFTGKMRARKKALETLKQLGVASIATKRIGELSGGQRQRVLIARALVAEPELLVLDEPTASLDTRAQSEFFTLMRELNNTCTIIVVSHDLLVISSYVKSVACVNRTLHYHPNIGSTGEVMEAFYNAVEGQPNCAVEHLQRLPLLQQVQQEMQNG